MADAPGALSQSREYFWLQDLRSDEVSSGGGQLEIARQQLLNGTFATDNSVNLAVWRGLYRVIHRANLVIDKAPGATLNLTDALRDRYVAEAKFMRGWAYSELAALWGGVPAKQNPGYQPLFRHVPEPPNQPLYLNEPSGRYPLISSKKRIRTVRRRSRTAPATPAGFRRKRAIA